MGTKNNPAPFDCYAHAEPDEPMFVLLARDASAPELVREWAYARAERKGLMEQDTKGLEALACADAMETWRGDETRISGMSLRELNGEPLGAPE